GLNLWHYPVYGGMSGGQFFLKGWTDNDNLENSIELYRADVQNKLEDNLNEGLRTLMARPKIERLAYGQRSDYQCEATNLDPDLLFYSYYYSHPNTINISDITDNDPNYGHGEVVKRCLLDPQINQPGVPVLICSGLKANREQVNAGGSTPGDRDYGWIVKPRIRIDSNFAHNNQNDKGCRIDVYNYDNILIKSTDILGRHFLVDGDPPQYYNGKYIEEFNFNIPNGDSDLVFDRSESINFNPEGKNWYVPEGTCHTDYKVYWYGSCDMWIDYVRVDNDIADQLFKGVFDNNWLTWEAELANYTTSPWKFYIEEFEFNN